MALYMVCGSRVEVSDKLAIHPSTLDRWMRDEWWSVCENEIAHEIRSKINSKLQVIIDKSLGAVRDRLENGDTKILRDGSTIKIPVSAKDAAAILNVAMERQERLQQLAQAPTTRDAQLDELAERLRQFAAAGTSQAVLQVDKEKAP